MLLVALKFLRSNWKLVAVVAVCTACFSSGYAVRGYIAEAEKNAAVAAAVEATKQEELKNYEKAKQVEEAKRKSREKARSDATRIRLAAGDNACLDSPIIPIDWLRISWEAISGGASKP